MENGRSDGAFHSSTPETTTHVLPGSNPGDALAAELQDFVKQKIAPYKYPRAIEFVPSLPRSSTGKVQHFVLREQAAKSAAERQG